MDFVVPSQVVYDFDGRASVAEVSKSLLAQERLLREALVVVQRIYPHFELTKVDVAVRLVSHASPFKTNLAAFVAGMYSTPLGEDMPDILEFLTNGTVDYSTEAGNGDVYVNLQHGAVFGQAGMVVDAHQARDTYGNIDTLTSIEHVITGTGNDTVLGD